MSQEFTVWRKSGVGLIEKWIGGIGTRYDCYGPDGVYRESFLTFEEALDYFGELDDLRLGSV